MKTKISFNKTGCFGIVYFGILPAIVLLALAFKYGPFSSIIVLIKSISVANQIEYVSDFEAHGVNNYWQTPEETLKRKTGDCEDHAILLAYYIKKSYVEYEPKIIIGTIEDIGHAWVKWNGYYYEATTGKRLSYKEYEQTYVAKTELTLNKALKRC